MSQPDTLVWLASHELRLGWRDWVAMMTAGHRRRMRNVAIALIVFAGFMHLLAYSMVRRYAGAGIAPDKATLVVVTGIMLLSCSLLLSQAMELVTRVFYSRSDLDLILTSPVSPRKIFSVRIGRIAAEVALFAMLLATPFIDVLAVLGGARWLVAYGVVAAMGAVAAAFAVALTVALFRTIGAKRTRLIAQIVAAVIGAAFVIGLQIAAIFSYGSLSLAPLQSAWLIAHVPDVGSPVWWPARAVLGDPTALILVVGDQHRAAWRGDPDFRGALRRSCGGRRRRITRRRSPAPLVEIVSPPLREPRAAAKGVDAARARSLADVADSDANPLSAAAGAIPVAHFSQRHRRLCPPGAHDGDGGRPPRWRPRLAVDLGRGRARPCRHRADFAAAHHLGEDRSGDGCGRVYFCAAGRRAGVCVSKAGTRGGRGRIDRHRFGHPDSALLPHAGAAQPVSPPACFIIAHRDFCGSVFVDRLGRHLGAGRDRYLARAVPGAHCH